MPFSHHKKSYTRILWVLLACLVVFVIAGAIGAYYAVRHFPQAVLQPDGVVHDSVRSTLPKEEQAWFDLLPALAGFSKPQTYLLLLQNNTELRPSGGFIGAYGVVTVDKGSVAMREMTGSETLDRQTPKEWRPVPPKPLTDHLGVDRWYFRDSNWSPDFSVSAQQSLALYKGEGGALADDIDMVVGITPTVLEAVLGIIGPVTVQGKTFTPDEAVAMLEYDVEFDYRARGDAFAMRKAIIGELAQAIMQKVKHDALRVAPQLLSSFKMLSEQGHIVFYSGDAVTQSKFAELGVAGLVATSSEDSLLWVDANLGALKTDHALDRHLSYTLAPSQSGYTAATTMEYRHTGNFDWRTSRYLTYARLFVPEGSTLAGVSADDGKGIKNIPLKDIDMGSELGRTWFGFFFSLEPGKTGRLSFSYVLPERIAQQIEKGAYTLAVQKQLGTEAHGLTVGLDFGTTLTGAEPREAKEKWGDMRYDAETDLRVNREFHINF